MIVNKHNLLAGLVIGKDKSNTALAHVHINEHGDTIACNSKTVFIIESLPESRKDSIPFKGDGFDKAGGFSLPLETTEKLIRAIPVDKHFDGLMEMVHINGGDSDGDLVITSHDGKSARTVTGAESKTPFVDYVGILKKLHFDTPKSTRFMLDRKRLKDTLAAMDKICGDSPAYIEVSENGDLSIGSVNISTGQRVFAFITGVVGDWQDFGNFVNKFKPKKKRVLKRRKNGKGKKVKSRS